MRSDARFQPNSTSSEAQAKATVGRSRVSSAPVSVAILAKNSPGSWSMVRPRKSLICEMKMTTAMPLVKPMTMGSGMKRISEPRRSAPIANSSAPASMVAASKPLRPWLAPMA